MTNTHPTRELQEAINKVLATEKICKIVEPNIVEPDGGRNYLEWSEVRSFSWKSAVFDGVEWEVEITVNQSSAQSCKALTQKVINALHNCDPQLEGHAVVDFQFHSQKNTPDGKGTIVFKVLTVQD